ncbi:hypothetical protein HG536_0A05770 [Torulaspora globosa]|uniref:Uncharacterized protein n=1 Tax=Torulaspora globosa TaxID=48254 RepID=A0A7G3ZB76_9SACH|nr:uncharacterized protein HG536_0A05770 [Torulaspora globosa]QLL30762.1 hypothetical protein HG536_0A05770 [Torulaspora globosa]
MAGTAVSRFCRGRNEDGVLPYLVELTSDHLFTFEMLNSMCLLDNYDHLLFALECQISSSGSVVVPPFDVLLVLMTLATVSEHYKEPASRANDPYNVSRSKLSHRSLKVLRFYTELLKQYDAESGGQYELELLRCQFFIIVDSLIGNTRWGRTGRVKRRRTENGVSYTSFVSESSDSESAGESSVDNPYRSYMSCLERKKRVLGNELLSTKLKAPGEFINMILWTLSNSLQENTALYISSHDIWLPLIEILVDLIVLRHDFYVNFELSKSADDRVVSQELSESPLASFLHIIDSSHSGAFFCRCLLLACDYSYDDSYGDIEVHPVFHNENVLSKTYVPRTTYCKSYKLKRSMSLRRGIIGSYFKLLSEVPAGRRLIKPRCTADQLLEDISNSLAKFKNIDEFRAFFITGDLSSALYFMPLLAEGTLGRLLEDFRESGPRELDGRLPLALIENLDDVDKFLRECTSLFRDGFFVPQQKEIHENQLTNIMKGDICLLVMFQYAIYLNSASEMKSNPRCNELTTAVYRNDKRRKKALMQSSLDLSLPLLRPPILKILKM